MTGKVYLVGAGPGDPGLITARGLELLRAADAVVHDRLVSAELIAERRADAEVYHVGKVPGRPESGRQREINELLISLARAGKSVVRLKGGDPFVFGRGGEEAEACSAADVPFEVVPGVTSAVAVAAYAGIPVTHRSAGSSFAVVTGHEREGKEDSAMDWEALARIDTLVILMAVETLPLIVKRLLEQGRPPETPIALVSRGTYPDQRTLTGTLSDIVARVADRPVRPPVTIVVGEVVRRREQIRWFDRRPLFGRRLLVPRTREQAGELASRLRALGADVVEAPRLVVQPVPSRLTGPLDRLRTYDVLLVTSPTAAQILWDALRERNRDMRSLDGIRVAAAGPGTEEALEGRGIVPDLSTPAYAPGPVADLLLRARPGNVLLLRQEGLPDELPLRLQAAGATVDDIAAYRVVPAGPAPDLDDLDLIVFASSGSVRTLDRLIDEGKPRMRGIPAVCMGPKTAQAAREYGFKIEAVAATASFDGLVDVALQVLRERADGPAGPVSLRSPSEL